MYFITFYHCMYCKYKQRHVSVSEHVVTCVLCIIVFLYKININSILHVVSFSLCYKPESIQQVCRTFLLYFVVFPVLIWWVYGNSDKQFQVLNYLNISLQKNQQLYKHIFHRASIKTLWRETHQQSDRPIRRLENLSQHSYRILTGTKSWVYNK